MSWQLCVILCILVKATFILATNLNLLVLVTEAACFFARLQQSYVYSTHNQLCQAGFWKLDCRLFSAMLEHVQDQQ